MARTRGKLGPITMTAAPVDRRPANGTPNAYQRAWFRIGNKGVGTVSNESTRVDIYEEIGGWGVTAGEFVEQLRNVTTPQIDLHISSPGGSVFDGVAIYNALSQHPARVHCYVDALAASAASFIAQAADEITMNPGSMMMVHDAIGMTWGNANDHTTMAGLLAQVSDSIADLYARRAGGTAAEWRGVMENNGGEGRWYNAREAVDAGLADRVAGDPEPGDSTGEPTQDATAPTSPDPREAYENSSLAAGHRLIAHYREQVQALAPPPAAASEGLLTDSSEWGAAPWGVLSAAACRLSETTDDAPLRDALTDITAAWAQSAPNSKPTTVDGNAPLINW